LESKTDAEEKMLFNHREHRGHRGEEYARGVIPPSVSVVSVLSVVKKHSSSVRKTEQGVGSLYNLAWAGCESAQGAWA
jgi:hypothetical protein